ncbi:PREDICTED: uncharacterized protein LOC109172840 isoform X2 [Ipomoea nil]|uniref:uncharacterized protein LOC109172840 isoform X2 n=1 Tax=Ipomoea nil TaxID=35883 RepID=UPI000901C2FF|nr:PREDICTED: uncharacterized protein LOC109172840 isoform X2 [Ipomoea nil]
MGYFDLNVPYFESDRHVANKNTAKAMRLKLIIKAMELGYTGVAYNRTIKGVMSESDRCSIPLFPLSSILKLAPSISSAVKLHRELLSVPVSAPFRQYTRLTVMVDSPAQASVLNFGNPVLKSYDIVAVKPLNQNAFDHACRTSEVDIITIDFSEKLLFRLKQPMVKAAIQRGVYFEITYSSLLIDAQARRQMISNAKLLVDWSRGKNIILTSDAPSVTEFRGPYDVVNLVSLLGLSLEHAKAALSKNCRTLIENALRKKCYYKETIKVEAISSARQANSDKPAFDDWLKWDPISSGEGDLLLDDIEKFFSAPSNVSQNVKPIDFTSAMNGLPPHGLQIRDVISSRDLEPKLLDAAPDSGVLELQLESHLAKSEEQDALQGDATIYTCREDGKSSCGNEMLEIESESQVANSEEQNTLPDSATSYTSIVDADVSLYHANLTSAEISAPSDNSTLITSHIEDSMIPDRLDTGLQAQGVAIDKAFIDTKDLCEKEPCLVSYNVGSHNELVERAETRDFSVSLADGLPVRNSSSPMKDNNECNPAECELMEDDEQDQMETGSQSRLRYQIHSAPLSGRKGRKKLLHRPLLFPFKGLLNHRHSKRKARRLDRVSKT